MSDMMKDPMVLRQIIMDHYQYPRNHQLSEEEGYVQRHMASDSCIDDIYVQGKVEDGVVKDIRFDGEACTISTASTSIMSELVKGKRGAAGQPHQLRHHRLAGAARDPR